MSAQLINLFESIKTGDINSVRKIIFADPELIDSVREDDYYEDTPLTFAANHDDENIVDMLLKEERISIKLTVMALMRILVL